MTLDELTQFDVKLKTARSFSQTLTAPGKICFPANHRLTIVGDSIKRINRRHETGFIHLSAGMLNENKESKFSNLMTYDRSFNTIMVAELREGKYLRDYGDTLVFTGMSLTGIEMDYFLSQIPESRGDFRLAGLCL